MKTLRICLVCYRSLAKYCFNSVHFPVLFKPTYSDDVFGCKAASICTNGAELNHKDVLFKSVEKFLHLVTSVTRVVLAARNVFRDTAVFQYGDLFRNDIYRTDGKVCSVVLVDISFRRSCFSHASFTWVNSCRWCWTWVSRSFHACSEYIN